MLHYVKDVNALKKQPWASWAITALEKGRYDGKGKREYEVFRGMRLFLQVSLINFIYGRVQL